MIYPVNGVDVSSHQGDMDWSKALDQGIQFAYIRATSFYDGAYRPDKQYHANVAELESLGIPYGVYGVLFAEWDPQPQIDAIIPLVRGQMPFVGDFERPLVSANYDKHTVKNRVREFVRQIEQAIGRQALIYTSPGWWDWYIGNDDLDRLLWVANYRLGNTPSLPIAWKKYKFWQWSADIPPTANQDGDEYGAHSTAIDKDRYNGTWAEFQAEFLGAPPPPPPPEPSTLIVTSSPANLRKTPDALPASRLGQLFKGTEVEVIRREGDYWLVKTEGYLHKSVVKAK